MEGCKMVEPYLNQVGGKVDNDTSLFTGGLNTYEDKAFLESNQMPYVMNMTMVQPPAIQTRSSRTTLANLFNPKKLPWDGGKIVNMWAYNQDLIYFIIQLDNSNYDLCMLKKNGSTLTYTKLHTLTSADYVNGAKFTYGRTEVAEFVYYGNESYKARIELGSVNPLDYQEYQDHFGIPEWHKGRMWFARPSEGKIEWSNALMPDDFLIGPDDPQTPTRYGDSGEVYISTTRGNITNILSFDDKLMVLCEHSMHCIYGSSGEMEDSEYFQVVDLLGIIGCMDMNHAAVSGGRMYWLGDNELVYEYTGASINIISRPGKTRNSTLSIGGVDNVLNNLNVTKVIANSTKLYIDTEEGYLFVCDAYNRTWWCEDGGFSYLANYSAGIDNLLMATEGGDILTYDFVKGSIGRDEVYDWDTEAAEFKDIEFEFHTRVYGADGADLRKTISDVWVQAFCTNGNGDVYINDIWAEYDIWKQDREHAESRYVKIGDFRTNGSRGDIAYYNPQTYEQRRFIVEKMFGQRLNTFQIVVKGSLFAKFYLMKREWRAR